MADNPLANLDLRLVDSIDEAMNLKRWLGERRETPLGLDTESGGLNPWKDRLRLIQVGDLHTGWVIPWPHWGGVWEEICRWFKGEWVLHNGPYDAKVLKLHTGFDLPWDRTHDTMTLSSLDNPLRRRDLKGLASALVHPSASAGQHLLKEAMAKQGWTWGTVPLEYVPYVMYSALDPVLACHMWKYLHPRVMASCPDNYDLERATLRIVTSMMLAGLRLDSPYMRTKRQEFLQREIDGKAWLEEVHGVTSVNSARQLAAAFETLGEKITEFTQSGLPQFDKDVLQGFETSGVSQASRDLARVVTAVRNVHRMGTTYLDSFEEMAVDGILHCSINPMQARTGRMSSSEPNLQNLPRDEKAIRGSFIPRDGCVLISCDADQIEARMAAHFGEDQGLIQAFHDADQPGAPDFFTVVARQLYQDPSITKKDLRRQLTKTYTYACVPLDYQVLTKRGFLKHDQVEIGDETIGFDPEINASRWTRINEIHRYDNAEMIRMANNDQSYTTTPNHRWYGSRRISVAQQRVWRDGFFTADEITGDTRLTLAAPLYTKCGLSITDDEAAVLGWLLSDGFLRIQYEVTGPAQAGGSRRAVMGQINQSEKKHAQLIDALLVKVDASYKRSTPQDGYVTWNFHSAWLRDLLLRANFFYAHWPDPVMFAAALSSSQREALLRTMLLADGDPFNKSKPWQLDLVSALIYMDGGMPRVQWRQPDGKGWTKKPCGTVFRRKPKLTGQRLSIEEVPRAPAWCVTTDLGTWTMRVPDLRGTRIVLTGNSIYGSGLSRLARSTGATLEQVTALSQEFHRQFPGLDRVMQQTTARAKAQHRAGLRPFVETIMGRPLPGEVGREYALLNYLIQGSAAEALKRGMVELESAGLLPYMRLPVHDEVLMEAPVGDAEEVLHQAEAILTDRDSYRVPITWSGDILPERWTKV
jgi:DNA polymerase I-like protein with 3'-5' exonuclease and polymerase domains